jgi:hypothetical protein
MILDNPVQGMNRRVDTAKNRSQPIPIRPVGPFMQIGQIRADYVELFPNQFQGRPHLIIRHRGPHFLLPFLVSFFPFPIIR